MPKPDVDPTSDVSNLKLDGNLEYGVNKNIHKDEML